MLNDVWVTPAATPIGPGTRTAECSISEREDEQRTPGRTRTGEVGNACFRPTDTLLAACASDSLA
ncbi:MAG: hypothetical protein JWP14_559 [Frankiales bacterium]|nr:hypothetical protein [Frankiales bacterium]